MTALDLFLPTAAPATISAECVAAIAALVSTIQGLPLVDKIAAINEVKMALHAVSPFTNEPVDCVLWLASSSLAANDYNPNSVAPPEMELLRVSVAADGYTQPIVSWRTQAGYEVVDGFHRTRVGKECEEIKRRVHGFLPVVVVNHNRTDRGDRIAATIRHNRARGKHRVDAMSDIVVELRRRNWSEERIGKELGMDPDEVLRLAQITGLAELFADVDFSRAWDIGTLGDTTNDEDDDGPEAA